MRPRSPPPPPPPSPSPQQDVEFAFEKARLSEWITDIKALIAQDLKGLPGYAHAERCLLPGYYVMRFGKPADSYIGMSAGLKEVVYVQVSAPGVLGGRFGGWEKRYSSAWARSFRTACVQPVGACE